VRTHTGLSTTETDDAGTLGVGFASSILPQWAFQRATLRILAVNDAAIVHYGYARNEFLGMTILQLHPVAEQDAAQSIASEPLDATPMVHPRLWRHVTATGERLVRLAVSDLTIRGAPARLVQTLDVTALHELLECDKAVTREEEARTHVEAVSRSKDALLATVGHEMRQPLAPLLAAISLMEHRVSRDRVRAREVIKRQVGVLHRLVDDLLDAARVQEGKVTLRRETTDLRTLVAEIVAAQFPEIATHGLVLDTHLPSTPVWVSIDATRFHQILSNLLANAVRHSQAGGRVRVRVDVVDKNKARLVVRDEGQGIDANVLPHIFEPFAQAESGANGGLGLGLSVVRALVELHGGYVGAASDGAGRGAEFVVTFPISSPPAIPVKTFASDLRSVAELIRVRAAAGTDPLDGALEGIDTALLIADDRNRVLNANRAALGLTGYSEEELEAMHVADLLAMNGEHAEDHCREFAVDGRQEGILVLLRKDGARVPVRYCAIRDVRPGLHLSALDAI
jgi:PAS domain S-box-containing protein